MRHQDKRLHHVWARERGEGRGDGSKVVPNYGMNSSVAEGEHQRNDILNESKRSEGVIIDWSQVCIMSTAITSLIKCYRVIARCSNVRKDETPIIS